MSRGLLRARATAAREGVGIALDGLRANRVRASLTVLGVVVGVATVTAMAAIVTGVRTAVTEEMQVMGPDHFVVERHDLSELQLSDVAGGKQPWNDKPPVTLAEARLLRDLPSVGTATPIVHATAAMRVGAAVLREVDVEGQGTDWAAVRGGRFREGRNFVLAEVERASSVTVLSHRLADAFFPEGGAVGQRVQMNGRPFEVVGVYRERDHLFADTETGWAVVPYSTTLRYLDADAEWLQVQVAPARGVPQSRTMTEVTTALRTARGLRPADANDFALTRQDAFQELFDRTTGVFVLVLLGLSSVGLAVGGAGVVATMTIAVGERTREIGIRKAMGATRGAILWQFLVEAVTLTLAGGAAGLALSWTGAFLLARFTPVPALVPPWAAVAALGVTAAAGIVFGLYPASRAARLDPVEALRHE